ncbi:NAD+ synthase [Candidatus Neptunochlamydia vexilliferae]|uniref:Glutamine-dependent NAD(+) synthetase n=1 Tax=Candidatus Neptunichlamydia vexilliferae TaxID=1651774 RepID=A0ABS0AXW1_9BACT|nr:NAD+ synthase [Candidatus Neptunochlamydia vexilliferae]MBF5058969.1 putative glutamine-dependent NAD(+) synthetase [Candidatus Neptunochlamydia vexilliferae]
MKILVVQLNPIVGDLDGNTAKILASLEEGRKRGVDLVMFGELTLCGYPPEDLVYHNTFLDSMELHLERIIKGSKGIAAIVGLVRRNLGEGEKHLLNSAAVINDGHLLGFQDKWLLPTYDVFEERRYFEPGKKTQIWEIGGKRVGLIICEDIWQHAGYVGYTQYGRDPVEALVEHKPEVLLNISASPYQFQKPDIRVNVCGKAAKTLQCPVVMCCQVGANGQIIFDGYSVYVNEKGELCQLAKGFEEDAMVVDLEAELCPVPFEYETMTTLLRALELGVKDYFAKCGFSKALLGLSGGIDSALVAYIAARALGPENVLGVSMPSKYTSIGSQSDAVTLAKNLGIDFLEIPIKEPFDAFTHLLEPHFQGKKPDIAEENLQARIRGIILMALSNKHGYIVLSTGNKSEVALGYSTLYGDMCGGLGVIGDVTKTKVYDLCRHINALEKKEVILNSILDRPPSAELRPDQMDLDSLPEYGVVDNVLEGYVEDYLSIDEISEKHQIPREEVLELIQKIHLAEYKRRQGPPILRVSKKSFGVGRRYPIVQKWL